MYRTALTIALVLLASAVAMEYPDAPRDTYFDPHFSGRADRDLPRHAVTETPSPVWTVLERLSVDERANSRIEIELPGGACPQARAMAVSVADFWNCGRYEEGLALLRSLGDLVDPSQIVIGNCWRTPMSTMQTVLWGGDARIGYRHSISLAALDIHRATGYLLAVLLFRVGPSSHYWTVNFSPNGGANWFESFVWYGSYDLRAMSASILTDYCYVGYGAGSPNREARVRRFYFGTGKPVKFGLDDDQMYVTAYTAAGSDTIKEIALTSNQDFDTLTYMPRLYCVVLLRRGAIKYVWSDATAVDWDTTAATGVADAANGLDACTNEGTDSSLMFVSFYDRSGNLRIIGRRGFVGFRSYLTQPAGGGDYTSIGAYHDTVLCAFDYTVLGVVRYEANYGGGHPDSVWHHGYPAGDTNTSSESPDVALRKGGGEGLVYRYHTPNRELRYIWRSYASVWGAPVAIADYEPGNNKPAIEYLGGGVHGVLYLRQSDSAAYFDRTDGIGIAEQRRVVIEEGILKVTPNPLSNRGRLNYRLNHAADLGVQLYDYTGRVVRSVFDGHSSAGSQSLEFDASGLAPGVYFIRADASGQSLTVPVTIVK